MASRVLFLVTILLPSVATSEDRVSVRGAYFREASTRVVQPMVHVTKDLPKGYDLGAHYLLDAITSASVAAGNLQDTIRDETRHEAGLIAGKTVDRTRVGLAYRYSREPDYFSHTAGLSLTQGVWENSGTVTLNLALTRDDIRPLFGDPKALRVYFGGLSYTQALSPTSIAQLGYELAYLDGYQTNPYLRHPNLGYEGAPTQRLRHSLATRAGRFFPRTGTGLQLHYRYYIDQDRGLRLWPWGIRSHTVEGRIYQRVGRHFELRLAHRYNSQGAAGFWCTNTPTSTMDCYGMSPAYHSVDVKFGALATHMPELKIIWDMHALAAFPRLSRLTRGSVEVSYGYFWQDTRYGGGHLLQTGYSLPF